ncbi:MAG: LysR family transcriptional regulator [Paracoccaceae bacterium]|nr:LysR family transcriptional regulator [Paracoccaceae bacterium]MDE3120516.1 LysR family transcriptional regulator [Paracoccaceae bacterium]MDE3239084.1 LysR family transcriptional regulator [Paracoccaceae bacterium]
MDLIDGLRSFVATAQSGSFTAAADRLGMSNRLTSKYVADLEDRLGVRLLQRTTRRVGLTPAGEVLLERAPALLEDLDRLLATVTEDSRGFSGLLRISAPVTFGEVYVQDMLRRFAALHPALVIDLRLDDSHVDLASAGIDLAFRIGEASVSTLKARRLAMIDSQLVAAPDYLARNGAPLVPSDLTRHVCIIDTNRRNPSRWTFRTAAGEETVAVRGRFMVNSSQVARDLAVAGEGIALCPRFSLRGDIESGRLIALLPEVERPRYPLSAVYLEGRSLSQKLRALIEFAGKDIRSTGLL